MADCKPIVSVLMTAYNRENYIGEAIRSVLASTFSDFELIVTDDQSTDNTVEIANLYARKDKRVRVYVNEKNLGDYPNRNKAASYALGKYLKYVDADDYIYPWGLQLLVEIMEQFPEAGWGLCSLEPDQIKPFPFLLQREEIFRYEYFGPGLFHKAPLSSIIKTECFQQVGKFSGKKHLGDYELWHKLAIKFPVVLMPHGIVWYRVHEEQESKANRDDPEVNLKYFISAFNYFKQLPPLVIEDRLRNSIVKQIQAKILKTIAVQIRRGKISQAYKLYKATKKKEYTFS